MGEDSRGLMYRVPPPQCVYGVVPLAHCSVLLSCCCCNVYCEQSYGSQHFDRPK